MTPRFWRRRTFWVGAAIFVAAAALRMSLVQTARFTGDEARDYAIGMDIAHGAPAPMLGPVITSGQARLPGPLSYWLAAFPQLFSRAPEAGNLFFELLGAASVWMFWFSLRRPFGEAGAAFAAALMALSPWSALFGDRVWNPNAFLFFEGLALMAAIELRENPASAWAAAVLPAACLALPHLHMSAPVVWLALLPLVAGKLGQMRRRTLVMGLVLGALLYIPFAVSEAKTGFGNTRAFIAETLGSGGKKAAAANLSYLLGPLYTLRFLTLDVSYHELSGYWGGLNETAAWRALWHGSDARPFHPLRLAALLASIALVAVCAVVAGRDAWRRRAPGGGGRAALSLLASPFALAALVAVAGTVLLLGLTSKQIFAHYVTPTMPFVFVLFAAAARAVFTDPTSPALPRLRPLLLALGIIVCAGGIEATLSISRRIDGRNGLAVHRAVAQRLLADCAAAGRTPQACPARLDFGFVAMPSTHAIFARHALAQPLRWEHTSAGFAYRLQKTADRPPPQAAAFPVTTVGPVNLYRWK